MGIHKSNEQTVSYSVRLQLTHGALMHAVRTDCPPMPGSSDVIQGVPGSCAFNAQEQGVDSMVLKQARMLASHKARYVLGKIAE